MIVILRTSPGGMRSCSSFMLEPTILPFAALYTRTCGWRRLGGFECCQAGNAKPPRAVQSTVATARPKCDRQSATDRELSAKCWAYEQMINKQGKTSNTFLTQLYTQQASHLPQRRRRRRNDDNLRTRIFYSQSSSSSLCTAATAATAPPPADDARGTSAFTCWTNSTSQCSSA